MSTATDELISAYLAELEREAARLPWNARTELLEDVRSHIEVAVAEIREAGEGGGDSFDEISPVRAMLSALGEPSEIVAAALADDPTESTSPHLVYPAPDATASDGPELYRSPTRNDTDSRDRTRFREAPPYPLDTADACAVALLLLGGFLAGIGWIIGAILLWTSARWTRAEKLIGTLILPGGIGGGVFAFAWARTGSHESCEGIDACVTIHTGWDPPGWLAAATIAVILLAPAATTVFLVNRARRRPSTAPATGLALAVITGVGTLGLLTVLGLVAATGTQAHKGKANPGPVEYSGRYLPLSSPTQEPESSSASTP